MSGEAYLQSASYALTLVETTADFWRVRGAAGEVFLLPRRHCSVDPPEPIIGQVARWSVPGWLASKRGLTP